MSSISRIEGFHLLAFVSSNLAGVLLGVLLNDLEQFICFPNQMHNNYIMHITCHVVHVLHWPTLEQIAHRKGRPCAGFCLRDFGRIATTCNYFFAGLCESPQYFVLFCYTFTLWRAGTTISMALLVIVMSLSLSLFSKSVTKCHPFLHHATPRFPDAGVTAWRLWLADTTLLR